MSASPAPFFDHILLRARPPTAMVATLRTVPCRTHTRSAAHRALERCTFPVAFPACFDASHAPAQSLLSHFTMYTNELVEGSRSANVEVHRREADTAILKAKRLASQVWHAPRFGHCAARHGLFPWRTICSDETLFIMSQDEFDDAKEALDAAAKAYAAVSLTDVERDGARVPIIMADVIAADEVSVPPRV